MQKDTLFESQKIVVNFLVNINEEKTQKNREC